MTHGVLAMVVLSTLALAACGSGTGDEAAKSGDAAAGSVLVQTALPTRQSLSQTEVLYGEVVQDVGDSESVSFARAIQISKLMVGSGQSVKRGDVLLEVTTDPNAATTYLQAQSAVAGAEHDYKVQQELASEHLATESQLASARKTLTDAQSALAAQQQLGAAPGKQVIHAGRDGIVGGLTAQQGDRIQAGTTVLQLSQTAGKRALLGAEPEDVRRLAPGMAVKITPVFGGDPVAAKISEVLDVINPQTRLVDVAVALPDTSSQLIPGSKVRGEISLTAKDVWAVPRSAVLDDADGAYVFQIVGGHAKREKVHVQVESGDLAGIDGAFDPKQPLVVLGNYELSDGMAVRTAEP
ncbi:MAG TPA: efflux RND transporter periplasmic adaptor subunit [Xanthomonadaceae bacterium]|jgi:membrane fusion protein (multidrug efflux system)|nr:efflux RND transporter periplasmic adaptor subunit [Xanthomonadaceae bacterium]